MLTSGMAYGGFLSFGNNQDDKIGVAKFHFRNSQLKDKLFTNKAIPLSQQWDNEGSWAINGRVMVSPLSLQYYYYLL
jgi:hypothetical protein